VTSLMPTKIGKPALPEKPAVYTTRWQESRGRFHDEKNSATRTPFQRDRDRIIHSSGFRRLKQKTQVFVAHEGDHYRTRLTHSLEVAQIARSVARRLGVDEDLAEAMALAHDLGHPPFGHAGEDQLDASMEAYEGFDHNAQTLRVVTRLEQRYPTFDGLNLTWEMLEGLVKHNGPLVTADTPTSALPAAFRDFPHLEKLELDQFAGPEAQIAALADDIAYNNHDIDDGIAAGLFSIDDMLHLPVVGDVFRSVRLEYPVLDQQRTVYEAVRRLIGLWIDDLVQETLTKAIARAELFHAGTNLRAWLFTIMRNTFYTRVKLAAREAPGDADCVSAKPAADATQEWSARGREIAEAIQRLPPQQREVLVLIGVLGSSYEETAEICNCAIGTVKSRLNRARLRLLEELGEQSALSSIERDTPHPVSSLEAGGQGR